MNLARRLAPRLLVAVLALLLASGERRVARDEQTPTTRHAPRAAPHSSFVPGEVIVLLRDAASATAFERDAAGLGYPAIDAIPQLGAVRLAVPAEDGRRAMEVLGADPRVASVEPHAISRAQVVPDDDVYRGYQWNLRKIGLEQVWDATTGSPEVVVAVLDTGVDASHPDLRGNILAGYDFVNDDPNAADDSSHGTYIAGVIAAVGNNGEGIAGVAWRSKILPVKVLDSQGLGPDAAVSKGIIFAVENRARVINLSSGTPFPSRLLEEAIRFAERRGVLVVAAAGNSGDRGNEVIYPAAYPSVLAVAATDEQDDVPPFSQRHPYVAVAAPGVDIAGTAWRGAGNGPYITSSGTSSAAPHVSGLAALLLAVKPELTAVELRSLILDTADPVGGDARDIEIGAGRLNAARAVGSLRPLRAPTPTPAPSELAPRPVAPTPLARAAPAILPSLRTLPQPGPLPDEPVSWFFAEGSTLPSFETWLVLQNPLSTMGTARITYMTQEGVATTTTAEVAPNSRRAIRVNDVVRNALVSIRIDAESTLFAERVMYFGHDAIAGVGARSPSRTWFLAEGSTQPPFDTWVLIQNPNPATANAHLTFMLESGGTIETDQPLPPHSRMSLDLNDILPAVGFATAVEADLPIVVERSMYFAGGGGGHGTLGVKTPGQTWFLAEGDTRPGFDTWILLQNPSPAVANVKITFFKEDATSAVAYYALDPSTRLSLFANTVVPNTTFGARIEADQPIIVERSLYVAGGQGGHNSAALPIPNTEWYVPDGSPRRARRETIALVNPHPEPAQADVTFTRADGQPPIEQTFVLRPNSRFTVDVNRFVPSGDVATRILTDKPIVVERSTYLERGATNAPGLTR
jgi:subtilisin family serine protease